MKKYPITFTTVYKKSDTSYKSRNNEHWIAICEKWKGKHITLKEAEENIDIFESFIFDGETIEIYNDYRE